LLYLEHQVVFNGETLVLSPTTAFDPEVGNLGVDGQGFPVSRCTFCNHVSFYNNEKHEKENNNYIYTLNALMFSYAISYLNMSHRPIPISCQIYNDQAMQVVIHSLLAVRREPRPRFSVV
jgi:hypothetical protein